VDHLAPRVALAASLRVAQPRHPSALALTPKGKPSMVCSVWGPSQLRLLDGSAAAWR
jgi:hypothetical protein